MDIKKIKKVNTGFYPTPLEKMNNLTKKIGKANLYIKRDDLTGLGFGGNKSRKLDYIVAEAIEKGYTTLLTYGGPQTNHGRMTAAAASKFGLKSIILCFGQPPEYASGNIILDRILGAEMCFMDTTKVRQLPKDKMEKGYIKLKEDSTKKIIDIYEKKGEKVYIVPIGGHSSIGTLGYINAVKEIMDQLEKANINIDYLVTGYGSTGTFAGLYLGSKYFNAPFKVVGISVSPLQDNSKKNTCDFINKVSKEFEMGIECSIEDLWIEGGYTGNGYNIPDEYTRKCMYLLGSTEGIFIDPCYTGKSFRGFIDLVENERFPKGSSALFLHTGGTPGIFTKEHLDEMQNEVWGKNITIFDYE